MHRSPGVFFDHDRGKTHSSGKFLYSARIIPYRGSWLDFEFDAKDLVYVRIDRRRKLPVTTLLLALGLDQETILNTFYHEIFFTRAGQGWKTAFRPDRLRGQKLTADLVDAATGQTLAEAGTKMTPAPAQEDRGAGHAARSTTPPRSWSAAIVSRDLINEETGLVLAEAGDELTGETHAQAGRGRRSPRSRSSTSTISRSAPTSATRWRSTAARTARRRCSTSTACCARASRRRWRPPRRCSTA